MRLLTEHPRTVGETYFEHMGVACRFSGRLLLAGLACLVHGLLPFLCTRTGSSTVSALYAEMVAHRQRGDRRHDLARADLGPRGHQRAG
jgi:hypothetical protein